MDASPPAIPSVDASEHVYLLFGKNGWIGGKLIALLKEQGKKVILAESRTYDRESVIREIEEHKPTHILNAAGVTGTLATVYTVQYNLLLTQLANKSFYFFYFFYIILLLLLH